MNIGTTVSIQTREQDLEGKLAQVHQYAELTASNLIELLQNVVQIFANFFCPLQNTGNYGWAFMWFTVTE